MGGAQARFAAVANHHGRAWQHVIVAMDGVLSCRERLDPGLDVSFPAVAVGKRDPVGTLRQLRAALGALRPDVLLTHNWGSIEWGLANRWPRALVRHVHVEDGFGPEERDHQLRRRVWGRRVALRGAAVVLPSRKLLDLARNVWRLDPARLTYVPNGIDLARFAAGRGGDDGVTVGTVAALRPEKNVARLLRAVALVAEARLVVVGDGAERGALTALADGLGIAGRVVFAGHMSDPAAAYGGMSVFALSSDTEQMPLTVLEAMAAGLPVAATDVGDVADMVAAENRPFIVARDDEALAGALTRLLADAALRGTVGAANRRRAALAYGQDAMFAAWRGVLEGGGGGLIYAMCGFGGERLVRFSARVLKIRHPSFDRSLPRAERRLLAVRHGKLTFRPLSASAAIDHSRTFNYLPDAL